MGLNTQVLPTHAGKIEVTGLAISLREDFGVSFTETFEVSSQ